jgi:UPF0716 protein FxsA
MRLGWIVLLVLSFPVLEAVGIVWMADRIGWWTAAWLVADIVVGAAIIALERQAWGMRLVAALHSGASPLGALFSSGRIVVAGGLLAFPGFVSDLVAVVLLALPPSRSARRPPVPPAANDGILEGEFRRETDDTERLR